MRSFAFLVVFSIIGLCLLTEGYMFFFKEPPDQVEIQHISLPFPEDIDFVSPPPIIALPENSPTLHAVKLHFLPKRETR